MASSFSALVNRRFAEAARCLRLGDDLLCRLSWEYGWHPHFAKKRGFGVTYELPEGACHMVFARKIARAAQPRADGVLRHEIGHAVDYLVDKGQLDEWASQRGFALPHTTERRADAIAECLWLSPIYYDGKLCVQTTAPDLHRTRPLHLGL